VSSFDGGMLSSVRGLWSDYENPHATPTSNWVVALTSCSDVGVGTPYSGTNVAPATTSVQELIASSPADGTIVLVSGVVVAAWSTTAGTSFGVAVEDPGGGPNAGVEVLRATSSPSTAVVPAIGDYVDVQGTWSAATGIINL
jgi:hypothetical protein